MTPEVREQLVALNQRFYDQFGRSFSESRVQPQPGFTQLLEELPQGVINVLDVGCGDGRFGRFLFQETGDWGVEITDHRPPTADYRLLPCSSAPLLPISVTQVGRYVGVDFSESLLAIARARGPGEYWQCDLVRPNCLDGLGTFDVIACLAALHHIPGYANRLWLIQEMKAHLRPGGRLFLAMWQFHTSERQRRKLRDWSEIGLSAVDVEPGDYLLNWEREGQGLRYVAAVDEAAVSQMAQEADLVITRQFYSDGREGNLSLYTVLKEKDER